MFVSICTFVHVSQYVPGYHVYQVNATVSQSSLKLKHVLTGAWLRSTLCYLWQGKKTVPVVFSIKTVCNCSVEEQPSKVNNVLRMWLWGTCCCPKLYIQVQWQTCTCTVYRNSTHSTKKKKKKNHNHVRWNFLWTRKTWQLQFVRTYMYLANISTRSSTPCPEED